MAAATRPRRTPLVRAAGGAAEELVAERLASEGWIVLERRLRVGALEIDLLVRRGDVVALVEVRGRRAGGWITPFDSVDARKRARLIRAARRVWIERFERDPATRVLRIDLAAVTWRQGAPLVEIAEGAIAVPGA